MTNEEYNELIVRSNKAQALKISIDALEAQLKVYEEGIDIADKKYITAYNIILGELAVYADEPDYTKFRREIFDTVVLLTEQKLAELKTEFENL